MDPLSALIGGGASLIGAFMNTSSTQAINAANLQQQMWAAQGGYLPGLVRNANRAGINPLAAIGIHTPSMGGMVAPDPGTGVANAGKFLASMKDPHQREMERLAERKAETDIQVANSTNINTMVDAATKRYILNQLQQRGVIAPGISEQGVSWLNKLATGGAEWMGDFWRQHKDDVFPGVPAPTPLR